jgi:SAM-dependent methyltransferase
MNPLSLDRKTMTAPLTGKGVEIGAGNLPMVFENEVQITYIDNNSQEELQKIFPEIDYPQLGKVVIGNSDDPLNLESDSHDFLVSAHVIEHLKNPFKSLEHWCKVVKEGGYLYIIFPNRNDCFDKGRPYTTVSHLAEEYTLDNKSDPMKQNLINHLREHYGNADFKGKEHLMDKEIDYAHQISIGVAHYHVFGVINSYEFFEYSREQLKFPLKILELQYKMGEIRYLLQKTPVSE